jgi:integrase
MFDRSSRVPSYRCKKVHGRKYACVSLPNGQGGGRDILLGHYGTKESKVEYARVIAEWQAADRRLPQSAEPSRRDLTINELMVAYLPYAKRHYRRVDGTATRELEDIKLSMRPLKAIYGHTLAKDFGPLSLKALRDQLVIQPIVRHVKDVDCATGKAVWREKLVRTGLARGVVNQRIGRIRRLFKWAVSEELVPESVYRGLLTVAGLQRGRSEARETQPVRPVSRSLVEKTLPHLSPTVADMLRLQLLTGARSGEICVMRACDIDMTGSVWLNRPPRHKTEHRGFGRVIPLGPNAQEIIKSYLKPKIEAYLFSPREAMEAFRRKQRSERKTEVQPSQVCRKKRKPRRMPGYRYHPQVLAHAVRVACERHGLEHWHPHQLRHSKATEIRREYGLDAARAVLGQHGVAVAAEYAELDLGKAVELARKLG